jgi:cytochrome c oxidase assembly protein subunit 15
MAAERGRTDSPLTPDNSCPSVWPHRLALLTAFATLPLLFIGGLVTSTGSGLAVPDWPTTFGYSMFLYPWSKMVGPVLYEHSHRLVASAVGLLTVLMAVALWVKEWRKWLQWLGAVAVGLVILQGVLGGLRVVLLEGSLAIVHACLAQAFFALVVSVAICTSAEWTERPPYPVAGESRLWRICAITTILIYIQTVFGAVLRHSGERLESHLVFAALVALHVVLVLLRVMRFHSEHTRLVRPALLLGALLLFQLALGSAAYFGKFTALLGLPQAALVFVTTMHVVVGAVLLATSLLLTLRSFRFSAPAAVVSIAHPLAKQYPV